MSIGIVGLGYVGLPLAVAFAEAGEEVVAVDNSVPKIRAMKAGDSYVEDISSDRLRAVLPKLYATTHYAPLSRTDAVIIGAWNRPEPWDNSRQRWYIAQVENILDHQSWK